MSILAHLLSVDRGIKRSLFGFSQGFIVSVWNPETPKAAALALHSTLIFKHAVCYTVSLWDSAPKHQVA